MELSSWTSQTNSKFVAIAGAPGSLAIPWSQTEKYRALHPGLIKIAMRSRQVKPCF
jgi:hypothetical protein